VQDECGATYTTTPSELQLHLSDIVEVLSEGLPLEAMMYPSDRKMDDLPSHLMTEKVTLTHTSVESAVIATTCLDEKSNGKGMFVLKQCLIGRGSLCSKLLTWCWPSFRHN